MMDGVIERADGLEPRGPRKEEDRGGYSPLSPEIEKGSIRQQRPTEKLALGQINVGVS